jgi:heat shock protein HtpX
MTLASVPVLIGHDKQKTERTAKAILLALLVPLWGPSYLMTRLLMLALSRHREFAADRGAVLLTGAPEQLMSALQAISGARARGDLRGGAAISPRCIISTRKRRFALLMDHPPLAKRLDELTRIARQLGKQLPARR